MGPLSAPRFFNWDFLELEEAAARKMAEERAARVMAKVGLLPGAAPYDPWAMPEEEAWAMPGVQEQARGWVEGIGAPTGLGMVRDPVAVKGLVQRAKQITQWLKAQGKPTYVDMSQPIPLRQAAIKQLEKDVKAADRALGGQLTRGRTIYGELEPDELDRLYTMAQQNKVPLAARKALQPELGITDKQFAHIYGARAGKDRFPEEFIYDKNLELAFNAENYGAAPSGRLPMDTRYRGSSPDTLEVGAAGAAWQPSVILAPTRGAAAPTSFDIITSYPRGLLSPNLLETDFFTRQQRVMNPRSLADMQRMIWPDDPLIPGLDWLDFLTK